MTMAFGFCRGFNTSPATILYGKTEKKSESADMVPLCENVFSPTERGTSKVASVEILVLDSI
ncbi:hypothetical protein D3C87_1955540 [compost metagenome]